MIKVLVFNVYCDNDFYWNLDSFPRVMKNDELKDTVCIFLDNPSPQDILDVINKIRTEFKNSFRSVKDKDYVRDAIYGALGHIIKTRSDISSVDNDYWETDLDIGNYSMSLTLHDYVEEEIVFSNTGGRKLMGYIDFDN